MNTVSVSSFKTGTSDGEETVKIDPPDSFRISVELETSNPSKFIIL